MILDAHGNPYISKPQNDCRKGINFDPYELPDGASAPPAEYQKFLNLMMNNTRMKELIQAGDRQRGAHTNALDLCDNTDKEGRENKKYLIRGQEMLSNVLEKRQSEEKLKETKKANEIRSV